MNAIELIKKERISQIEKHGYDLDHDFITNSEKVEGVDDDLPF